MRLQLMTTALGLEFRCECKFSGGFSPRGAIRRASTVNTITKPEQFLSRYSQISARKKFNFRFKTLRVAAENIFCLTYGDAR
jgi:hypothetical protein